jgi:hypothetical protein
MNQIGTSQHSFLFSPERKWIVEKNCNVLERLPVHHFSLFLSFQLLCLENTSNTSNQWSSSQPMNDAHVLCVCECLSHLGITIEKKREGKAKQRSVRNGK